jgi:unconventional prefoldin RPB5 interactor 1
MDLLELETQRRRLEDTLQSLRTTLKHYQVTDSEYEGLKEEIEAADDLDVDELCKTCAGDVMNEKEIRELAGLPDSPRTGAQIIAVISRRQDYVQKNIETIQRQFWAAESKLEELDFAVVAANRDSDGGNLPLTEIHEELDDDGNVISSSVTQPENTTGKIIDSLRKAGLSDQHLDGNRGADEVLSDSDDESGNLGPESSPPPSALADRRSVISASLKACKRSEQGSEIERPPIRKKSVSFSADTKPAPEPLRRDSDDGKKSVSFNDKVAVMPSAPPPDTRSVSFSAQVEEIPADVTKTSPGESTTAASAKPASDFQKALRGYTFKPGAKVGELNDDDELVATHIVMPEDESETDAATRREMLEYHLNEVGHVVAEMTLEDDEFDGDDTGSASDFAASDYLDEDTPYTSGLSDSDVESEDEFGRTKSSVISDDYHKEMRELERRLIGNLGPAPAADDVASVDPELDPQDVHRLVIREKSDSNSNASSDGEKRCGVKKRVSFAEALNVADDEAALEQATKSENTAPIAGVVSERTAAPAPSAPHPTPSASRFKPARPSQTRNGSSSDGDAEQAEASSSAGAPPGAIMADTLVERPVKKKPAAAPSDDSDRILQRRELAAEYYRRRNEIIRQQGGFKANADEDEEQGELMEERDGKVKKVSRFRAARIK